MAFIDQVEFEAMKTLSGWEAARCDEHLFRAFFFFFFFFFYAELISVYKGTAGPQ